MKGVKKRVFFRTCGRCFKHHKTPFRYAKVCFDCWDVDSENKRKRCESLVKHFNF